MVGVLERGSCESCSKAGRNLSVMFSSDFSLSIPVQKGVSVNLNCNLTKRYGIESLDGGPDSQTPSKNSGLTRKRQFC